MAKLSLKANPTFEALVRIPRLDGEPAEVRFTFKHFTKDEFHAMQDRDAQITKLIVAGKEVTLRPDEERVMELACGWELDDPFTLENVRALCQHYIGACPAVVRAFAEAYTKARLGN